MSSGTETAHPVGDVLDRLHDLAGEDSVALRDLVMAFGPASFVSALMVPTLLVISPLSGIPFFSTFCGLTIALIAGQMLFHADHLWLPDFLMNRKVPGPRLRKGVERLGPVAGWIDRHTKARLRIFTSAPLKFLPQLACVVCGASMPFLELLPFSSSILGAAVLCFSISFLARDGLFVLAGGTLMGVAALVPTVVLIGI